MRGRGGEILVKIQYTCMLYQPHSLPRNGKSIVGRRERDSD